MFLQKQRWNRPWFNQNKFFCLLAVLMHLLASQCPLVSTRQMVSSSTARPANRHTTPQQSAQNKFLTKHGMMDVLTFDANLGRVKLTKVLLTKSAHITKLEADLAALQHIIYTVVYNYGFKLKHPLSPDDCAYNYIKEKAVLLKEISALLHDCKTSVDNIDMLHLHDMKKETRLILYGCSQRTKTLPLDVAALMHTVYYTSYLCTINSVMAVVAELTSSTYFEYVDHNSMLLLQELDHLLHSYKTTTGDDEDGAQHQENNQTGSFDYVMSLLNKYQVDLAKLKHVVEANVTTNAMHNFTQEVGRIMEEYQMAKQNNFSHSWERPSFFKVAKALREIVFGKHLKITDLKDDPIDNWVVSKGVNKVLVMNNLLRELVYKTSVLLPKSKAIRTAQQDLDEAELFTGASPTLGKTCENSPNHLVGTCTPENNEICRNVLVNWGEDVENQLAIPAEELNLLPHIEVKHCICGFRTGCYDKVHKTKRATCFLAPNEQGQCLGGPGYPCKTHPLENGKYDESCLSGFCRWETNSCEERELQDVKGFKQVSWKKVNRFKSAVKKKMEFVIKLFR